MLLNSDTRNADEGEGEGTQIRSSIPSCAVEFVGPGRVRVVEEAASPPGPRQLLLRSECSLVSTGTEVPPTASHIVKVFKGDMDPTQAVDLTIESMKEAGMTYPLRYGYSLVGRVVEVGCDVDGREWLGRRVFAFSPHAAHALVDVAAAIVVPEGVDAEDAVFLPSMETAVSLAMAARPVLGERVGVVGQGLIGLLTAAAIHTLGVQLCVVDILEDRLALAASLMSGIVTLNPKTRRDDQSQALDLDVCVEVSGNMRGLQTAVDLTGDNGRIVLGSWYGEQPAPLKLGMRFHRSNMQLVASQVSHVPAALTGRWTKARRFALTWDMLRRIRPSRMLAACGGSQHEHVATVHMCSESEMRDVGSGGGRSGRGGDTQSEEVQAAYEALAEGRLVTALFRYTSRR